jgi:hypothetical protein
MDRTRVTTLLDEAALVARRLLVTHEPVLLPTRSLQQLAEVILGLIAACRALGERGGASDDG